MEEHPKGGVLKLDFEIFHFEHDFGLLVMLEVLVEVDLGLVQEAEIVVFFLVLFDEDEVFEISLSEELGLLLLHLQVFSHLEVVQNSVQTLDDTAVQFQIQVAQTGPNFDFAFLEVQVLEDLLHHFRFQHHIEVLEDVVLFEVRLSFLCEVQSSEESLIRQLHFQYLYRVVVVELLVLGKGVLVFEGISLNEDVSGVEGNGVRLLSLLAEGNHYVRTLYVQVQQNLGLIFEEGPEEAFSHVLRPPHFDHGSGLDVIGEVFVDQVEIQNFGEEGNQSQVHLDLQHPHIEVDLLVEETVGRVYFQGEGKELLSGIQELFIALDDFARKKCHILIVDFFEEYRKTLQFALNGFPHLPEQH